jgi:hypothetical protein
MFGHGQVEGYSEKYGMEYRRAYRDETPDTGFVQYHDDTIAPLLHRRYIFADVENFLLYHFFNVDGHVIEDVFAYSNRAGDSSTGSEQAALVIYHNKFGDTRGWVKNSVSFAVKAMGDEYLVKRTLVEGLDLVGKEGYVIFRDLVTGLEYIRSIAELEEKGLYVELNAYQRYVFLDFRVVGDEWREIYLALNGAGVESVDGEWEEVFVEEDDEVMLEEEEIEEEKGEIRKKEEGKTQKKKVK